MAVAEWGSTEMESPAMKTLIATALFTLSIATAAQAGDWTNSGMYNGYGASTMNSASAYSMRDANGNLTMVNGVPTSAQYSAASQSGYAGGVGTAGGETQSEARGVG